MNAFQEHLIILAMLQLKAMSMQSLQEAKKAKRGILETMRQGAPNRSKMLERMSAFQPIGKKVI